MLLNAFRRLFNNSPNRKARRASSRPELLQLEGRIVPATITSATYDASTNVLAVTGAGMTAGDTIVASGLTIKGANGSTYALTSSNTTASSATAFSLTLNTADQLVVEGLLNKTGTSSTDSTTYNLSASSGWDSTASASADTINAITVSNVQSPTIVSATYNAATGVLAVTGTIWLPRWV